MAVIKFIAATVFAGVALALVVNSALASGDDLRRAKERRHEMRQAQIDALLPPPADPGIIGGTVAPAGAWPFQVALLYRPWGGSNYDMEYCGGSLVDNLHVVTAAHCVHGHTAHQFWILTNTQSLVKGGTRHAVASIKAHPNYNDNTVDYDVAVITLQAPVTGINSYPALTTAAQEMQFAKAGTLTYAMGWGSTVKTGGGYPKNLMQVQLPIVSTNVCASAMQNLGSITARMICAGPTAGGKDTCDGDSGGPLVVKDANGKWLLQVGIVSWGADTCALANKYGVYSRVAVLRAWIQNVIGSSGADVAEKATQDCTAMSGAAQTACLDRMSLSPQ